MAVDERWGGEPSVGVQRLGGVDTEVRTDAREPAVLDGQIDEPVASNKTRVAHKEVGRHRVIVIAPTRVVLAQPSGVLTPCDSSGDT
jgi:hypothetical protein